MNATVAVDTSLALSSKEGRVLKGFVTGVGLMVLVIGGFLFYRSYTVQCPCGFKYDALSGGCVVDLHAGPCTDPGGGNRPGQSSSSGGPQTVVAPPNFPDSCGLYVASCTVRADWKAALFTLVNSSGTVPLGPPPKLPVTLSISQRDKQGASCVKISGTIDVPTDTPITIPFETAALSGSFPIASSSTSGTPSTGLLVNIHEGCPGALTQIVAFPKDDAGCACKVSFKRDTP
jgi:hypothetical protein